MTALPNQERQEWRAACRQLAQKRAHEEALRLWEIPDTVVVPFEYRWEHVKEVVALALQLCQTTAADAEIVEAAAWLHDIRKMEKKHAIVGAAEAGPFLAGTDFPPEKIAGVVDAIAKHEGFLRPPGAPPLEPVEAAVLWDADKLTKLGVAALLFSFASPYVKGEDVSTRYDYVADFTREVLHQTVTSMNTVAGRAMAEKRLLTTTAFLDAWAAERNDA
jgi:uncharacterized protein